MTLSPILQTMRDGWNKHASGSYVFEDDSNLTGRKRVGTTDFTRHRTAMNMLATYLLTRPDQNIHVLSAPCSIGCEPYAFILEAFSTDLHRQKKLTVDAFDISPVFVEAARAAIYPQSMIPRDLPVSIRHHFEESKDGMVRISNEVRKHVHFLPAQDLTNFVPHKIYNAAMVLNLLIQLHDQVSAEKLAATISRIAPHALLLNNIMLVKRNAHHMHVVPYPHWPILEKALRETGYITAASTYDPYLPVFYGTPPHNLQSKISGQKDITLLFARP